MKKITRNIENTTISLNAYNPDTKALELMHITLTEVADFEKELKAYAVEHGITVCEVLNKSTEMIKYEMSIEKFIENAQKVTE